MGLDDREALQTLQSAVDPEQGSATLIRNFYTQWFATDLSARDLFPPDMTSQRDVFARALTWLFEELIAQRAEEPVAFLAQLGRDHRKYGVTQSHYDSMQDALYTSLHSHLESVSGQPNSFQGKYCVSTMPQSSRHCKDRMSLIRRNSPFIGKA